MCVENNEFVRIVKILVDEFLVTIFSFLTTISHDMIYFLAIATFQINMKTMLLV